MVLKIIRKIDPDCNSLKRPARTHPLQKWVQAQPAAAELAGKGLLGTQPVSELKEDRVWKCCHRPRAPGSLVAAGSRRAPKEAFGGRSADRLGPRRGSRPTSASQGMTVQLQAMRVVILLLADGHGA